MGGEDVGCSRVRVIVALAMALLVVRVTSRAARSLPEEQAARVEIRAQENVATDGDVS